MRAAVLKKEILIADPDSRYNALSKFMRWDKKKKCMRAAATLETLAALEKLINLTPSLQKLKNDLLEKNRRIDAYRADKNPRPTMAIPLQKEIGLYAHQVRAVNMAMEEFKNPYSGFGLFLEMGLGKTLTAIAIAGCLYSLGKVKRVLVVAPTSVCAVWPNDLEKFAGFPWRARVLTGDKKHRLAALQELQLYTAEGVDIVIINYELIYKDWLMQALKDFDADLIVADESQRIKSNSAQQSKAMHKLGDIARYKLILSGTPVQNNAVDLYSQYRFMDSSIFGTNLYAFKNRYCIMGGYQCHQIVGYQRQDELIKKVHSVALRVTKDEALDLPAQTFENRYVYFSNKERKIYDKIRRDGIAELETSDKITATTVLTKLLRLQQFTGGFLTNENGQTRAVNTAKLDALADILQDYVIDGGQKLVIFARFTAEIAAIEKLLKKKKIQYGVIHGGIDIADRGNIVKDFQENSETTVFLAQLQCAGLGITLTAASTAVYYSLNFNYADYAQSLARIHRIGQTSKCHYIHLLADNSVDLKTLKALEKKGDIAKTLVDNWRDYFND